MGEKRRIGLELNTSDDLGTKKGFGWFKENAMVNFVEKRRIVLRVKKRIGLVKTKSKVPES